MTTTHSTTPYAPRWIALGVRAKDTATGRVGIIQLLSDKLGSIRTEPLEHPTRAVLRPVGRSGPPWWASVADLKKPEAGDL
ncbi:hypothetical protein [Streptomyces sp. NPDC000410]|uniref:hypothetical protein n=1 Tax=Streptomyces sp. NPDC000410 TaxID=3154254 RepID=UPI00331B9E45